MVNVNNKYSTGSTVLWLARQAAASGATERVIAVGFEQMQRGPLTSHWDDRLDAMRRGHAKTAEFHSVDPVARGSAQLFGGSRSHAPVPVSHPDAGLRHRRTGPLAYLADRRQV
ncbi:hypothetical protein ACFVZL_28285 [Streptomyces sp. NPDC058320]|uniref:hypothetical protein n=1 Tax=unclassified Streptomyces TaxID=2593676 RepID=UPI0036305F1D